MVELLKRNHDVMMEKYEMFRQRNELLEKKALDKETLYVQIKHENDELSGKYYAEMRTAEELRMANSILESKFKQSESLLKQSNEQANSHKLAREQLDGQVKMLTEQLELLQKSYEQIAVKKTTETDLLTKDLNIATVKERDLKNSVSRLESEVSDLKEQTRSALQELDVRTKENDHLVSMLEDQEQRIALYEEKEKSIYALATDSKKRIEDANLERDRVLLKEQ